MRPKEVSPGVYWLAVSIANVYFVGRPGGPWVLIDAGIPGRARQILGAAEFLYGAGARPQAIMLTHGHMDHSGSASELAQLWDVPIIVHPRELPFVKGKPYPPGDPTVGGFLAMLGRFFTPQPIDLGDRVRTLGGGRQAPGMPGWEWHPTPGHTPGHVAFFRRSDGTLLAGDAVATVNLDSLAAVASQTRRVSRPPAPFTMDWQQARESVQRLADLRPLVIAAGHGKPMSGGKAVMQLAELATDFPIPAQGRYVEEPVRTDENGIVALPPKPPDVLPGVAIGLGIVAAAGTMFAVAARRHKRKKARRSATADTPLPAS